MQALDLIEGENHIFLRVFQTSNSFGDQILEFVYTHASGRTFSITTANPEGHWAEFNRPTMLQIYLVARRMMGVA